MSAVVSMLAQALARRELLQEELQVDRAEAKRADAVGESLHHRAGSMSAIADLAARMRGMRALEVGDRVAFGAEETVHGYVVELKPNHDGTAGAWLRVMGQGSWMHWEPLTALRSVCGICSDCLALNDRPACMRVPARVVS